MTVTKLLVANRGEIAVRICHAAAALGVPSVAIHSIDDEEAPHPLYADHSYTLNGTGLNAYLDMEGIITAARSTGCDALHPGYGFLAENAEFARRCGDAGIAFVGPSPQVLEVLGDKARARSLAEANDVPVLPGISQAVSLEDARGFLEGMEDGASIVIKAVAGGGGRGMRVVSRIDALPDVFERCRSEARAAFGDDRLYVERFLADARHIEVQVLGDSTGAVSHLWERDCSVQRRHQKLIEIAPAFDLDADVREALLSAATRLAAAAHLDNLATFEFLVGADAGVGRGWYFIEANARLQVEHTVTEEVTGVDLVRTQIRLAGGTSLEELGLNLSRLEPPRGAAMELRVNTESIGPDGTVLPRSGTLRWFDPPRGHGIRVDTAARSGDTINPAFDSLLAKVIVHQPEGTLADLARLARRALGDFQLDGVETNASFLRNLLDLPEFTESRVSTTFVERHLDELFGSFAPYPGATGAIHAEGRAGAALGTDDPLAVLEHGKTGVRAHRIEEIDDAPAGFAAVRAPMQGTIINIAVSEGDMLAGGAPILVMEAMKMEHVIAADAGGIVRRIDVGVGDAVYEGHVLVLLEPVEPLEFAASAAETVDLDAIREDLAEVHDRHEIGLDAARPDAVAARRKTGQRTARENVYDLCDEGSFVEYGPLVIAAQRRRRTVEDLIERTPADGLIAGIGTVNAADFGPDRSRVIAMSYDYTVLAGTQGAQNHRKKDRMFELAEQWRLPVAFFTEGGGGRPGDTDGLGVAGLDCWAFNYFGRLSGLVPLVGIVSGRCFAGNAALLGCCDVVIATANANIGMGGPAMIEGGGLGVFRPDEVGPTAVQSPNGVIDVLVEDEAAAVNVARRYLSYFQGPLSEWSVSDQRALRHVIPENRRRVYDVRAVIDTLADDGSVLELRRDFGNGMVTALARIEGRPLGIISNNPMHLAGAIDSDGADKASRFMQLCDAFDLPLLFLCDTPGIMVGPEIEKTALVRHAARMFVTGANVSVPVFTIVLRKAYGLGAQAMAGGSFKAPFFTVAWPTGEFGGMGLEGAVKLGYRNELAAIDDPEKRKATFDEMVERMYRHGKAVNTASHFEIDDVIDPVDSRRWVVSAMRSVPPSPARTGKKRQNIDTW